MYRFEKTNQIYKVMTFALPISFNMLINMFASFVAMSMIAKLGKTELAAAALAVATFIPIITTVICIFYALGILISHERGQGKKDALIGSLVKNGFWLAAILSMPVGLLLWNADKILALFNQNPELVKRTHLYFHFAAFLVIPHLVGSIIIQFFSGIGHPKWAMRVSLITLPCIVFLSYGLILGHFGLPLLGLAGITSSLLIVQSSVCIIVIFYMFFAKKLQKYAIFRGSWAPNLSLLKKILFLGLPIGIQFGTELFAIMISAYMLGYFGVSALAAMQIVSQYMTLGIMIILGLSQGIALLVSEAYAKKDIEMIKQYIYSAMMILISFFTIIFLIFFLAPELLMRFFVNNHFSLDSNFILLTSQFFTISGVFLLIDGFRNLFSGTLRGMHDSKTPMKLGIICLWCISLPVSYLIGFTFSYGPIGLRIGFLSGFIIAAILLWFTIRNKIKLFPEPQLKKESLLSS